MHSKEGFEVSVLNGIEAPVKDGEVVEAVGGDDEGVRMAIGNNEDHEIPDENDEDYEDYEDYEILDENNENQEIVNKNNESMKRDEALNRKLNFGNSESCRVKHKLIIVEILYKFKVCFNLFFFISDLFLIFYEFKEKVKNGDDEE